MAQQLENLCVYGIQCFPTPTDVLFAAHKHRYMSYLLRSGVPIIPTVFIDPSDTHIASAIKLLCNGSKTQLEQVYLKRGISEGGRCVWKLKPSPKVINAHIRKHSGDQGAFWLLQPPIRGLDLPEIKLFFTLGAAFVYGLAQHRTREKSVYHFEELRVDSQNWKRYRVDEAILFAAKVYHIVSKKARSLGVVMRIDTVLTDDGFLVNEVEHFGNMWLLTQYSSMGSELLAHIVGAVHHHLVGLVRQ
jgi:hypothetical protein